MMAVPVTLSPQLRVGRPQKLFDWQKPREGVSGRLYDVAPDGRFLVTAPVESSLASAAPVSVILNWVPSVRQQVGR
jgi:hypothetical protein